MLDILSSPFQYLSLIIPYTTLLTAQFSLMEPPPLQLYNNKTALITSAKDFAAAHGYALVIKQSKETKVWLKCDRGEAYRNRYQLDENHRIRSTRSHLIDCPMMVLGTFKRNLEALELSVTERNHNHKASKSTSAHPSF